MGKKYMGRVGQLIRRKLTHLLMEANDPRLMSVTITDINVNRDTTRAEVYYSIIGTEDELAEVQVALTGASGWLRSEMAPTLRLRNLPHLVFIYDPSLEHGERIDALLEELHDDDDHDDEDEEEDGDEEIEEGDDEEDDDEDELERTDDSDPASESE